MPRDHERRSLDAVAALLGLTRLVAPAVTAPSR